MKTLLPLPCVAAVALASLALSGSVRAETVQLDKELKPYEKTAGVTGTLNSVGSDTLNNLMTLWAEGFKAAYPNVKVQIEGKGSSTAPPAMIEGTAQLGPMSREMKADEIDKFEARYGYKPTEVKVAIDALAVYVHKDNPVKGLTLQQVDGAFSTTFKRGGKNLTTWGNLGLTGPWASRPLSLYGRNSASGTYGFFKDVVLNKGDFKPSVKEQPGSSSVVQGIGSDIAGMGYSGIGYKTSGVRIVPLAEKGEKFVEANYENCLTGEYPLARFLYVYINKKPGAPADKLVSEFIKYIGSREGQQVVIKDGYYPLPASVVAEDQALLSK